MPGSKIAHERLTELRRELINYQRHDLSLSPELVTWLRRALRKYLQGQTKTLDAAFDLGGQRGRPANDDQNVLIARWIRAQRQGGKSWEDILGEPDRLREMIRLEKRIATAQEQLILEHLPTSNRGVQRHFARFGGPTETETTKLLTHAEADRIRAELARKDSAQDSDTK